MDLIARLALFSVYDLAAVVLIFVLWALIGLRIEHPTSKRPSMSYLMADYRREWMMQMLTREPRIFDAGIMASLRQGTAFFASASLIAVGGILAAIGNTERIIGIAGDLTLKRDPAIVWEVKLFVILFFVTNAFLKFVWSNRLFGYSSVVMAAVPNNVSDPAALPRARQAGEINVHAARGFNRGLRSLYFGLASAAWLGGPIALAIAAVVTCMVLWRREFASRSRDVLLSCDLRGE